MLDSGSEIGIRTKNGCAPTIESFLEDLNPPYRPGSILDTDCITYRCFLPDLTRFATVCCEVAGHVD